MSVAKLLNDFASTDKFNRGQSQRAGPCRCRLSLAPAARTGLLRVLVVDDERDTADGLSLLVAHWGHAAQKAYDGATALGKAARLTPDVVLLDIGMPDLDGCELARRVRRDEQLRDCFLIAISGFTDAAHRQRCRDAGIDLFLIKPVDSALLESLLELERVRLGRSRSETLHHSRTVGTVPRPQLELAEALS
jgi:CheY-like chemotaxis protein